MNTLGKIFRTSAAIFGVACLGMLSVGNAAAASPEIDALANGDASHLIRQISDTLDANGSALVRRTGTAPVTSATTNLSQIDLSEIMMTRPDRRYMAFAVRFENYESRSVKVSAFNNTQFSGNLDVRLASQIFVVGEENPSHINVQNNRINLRWDVVQVFHFQTRKGTVTLKADRLAIQRNYDVYERELAGRISDTNCSGASVSLSSSANGPDGHSQYGRSDVVEASRCVWAKVKAFNRETASYPNVQPGPDAIGSTNTWETARALKATDRLVKATTGLADSGDNTYVSITGCEMLSAFGLAQANFGGDSSDKTSPGALIVIRDADEKGPTQSTTEIIALNANCN